MNNTAVSTNLSTSSLSTPSLAKARALALPSRDAMLARAPTVQAFWDDNRELFTSAWQEWQQTEQSTLPVLTDDLFDNKLRAAVNQAWQTPVTESEVKNLWQEVAPGVYQTQFFNPERLAELRDYFTQVADAGIPLRPPYGIALNRFGAMLDERSEGYLAAPSFQAFYQELMNSYMRPIARMLFPDITGYDTQTFGFSIQYQAGVDTSLRLHTDASAATLNINMNLPGEEFTGSEVDFYDRQTGAIKRLSFAPGTALIHRGSVAHAAQPIKSGQRSNLVFWLYGDRMQIPRNIMPAEALSAEERWTMPKTAKDSFAPF
ncbi:2OG-Fe(II) oxygenase [Thalassotalea euphylliae]|uniref:2OG-Fe(II) oxygenase n=1 Tax=Thalassotalea euphylliae TaxID=1655234 RepID=A0A3E0U0A9_9GAMM|nr:2OG-Fe(II) oxygenase [Thalassotalea euphylliae]REL30391.1 2OG-Fe(II) oxygenase [Thalassotalea euphylliae]